MRPGRRPLRSTVQSSVSEANLIYTFDCESVYDMLVSLKRRFAPTTQARERQLIYNYQALKKAPKSLDIDEWLLQWEGTTYTQCQKCKNPEQCTTFVDAAGQVHPGFTDY